jgi:hypothetical protein
VHNAKKPMRIFLTIIFNFIILATFAQSKLGIGLVSIDFDDKTKIEFYESSDMKKVLKTIEFFNDESINSWNIKDLKSHQNWLQPESLWLDYYQFTFRAKTIHTDCYEVYVSDNRTMWIKKTDFTNCLTWEEYLQNMFSVERIEKNTQNIYSRPFTKSEIIKLDSKDDCFSVIRMQNEWVEIETSEHCENGKKVKGWIKWRNNEELLINYYTTS